MKKRFQIFVEGDADKKFLSDYYHHLFSGNAPKNCITHTGELSNEKTGGYRKLLDEANLLNMRSNIANGGVNLVIFDADEDFETRRKELLAYKQEYGVEFDIYGIWDENQRKVIYQYIVKYGLQNKYNDLLAYLDKDIERNSLASFDIEYYKEGGEKKDNNVWQIR